MPPSPYDNCPCGSGKKFKWCCTPYFDQVEIALDQQQKNQHDAALRTMQGVTQAHADKPPVWGYYAHILFAEGKTDEAEEAIQKAYAIQPDFAMGHLLRGLFRQAEGEIIGALLLFRKAFEAYPNEAGEQIAQVGEMIARNELMLNRPVAARAVLERAVHLNPADNELREQFEQIFGTESRIPMTARKKYTFRPMTKALPAGASTGKISDARKAFETVVKDAPTDPAAWYNLGVCRAWLGEQPSAVEALNKSVELESDDVRAMEAAALVEVLKCASGMENDADTLEHRAVFPIRDAEAVFGLLQVWDQQGRLAGARADEQGSFFGAMIVEELPSLIDTGIRMVKVQANLNIMQGMVRLWHPVLENVRKVAQELRDRLNLAVSEPQYSSGPVQLGDVVLEALAYPSRPLPAAEAEPKMQSHATAFYENVWITRPLRALGGANPVDAVGSNLMRKRLLGVIQFHEDCIASIAPVKVYDFSNLRHKLGLGELVRTPEPTPPPPEVPAVVAPVKPAIAAPAAPAKREVTGMNAAELASLLKQELPLQDVEDAMKTAIKLDARELAVAFAQKGSEAPNSAEKPDRYAFFATLMTGALAEGSVPKAVEFARKGAAYDAQNNGGKRGTDYGLRVAALLAKSGDSDGAAAEFETLLERLPEDGNLLVKATEAMISAKNGAKALGFAERGLALAQSTNNRDLEGACRELIDAAKRHAK
ncbi:MAG: tetratricopeptide repeat protein [Gemmataceae bacterium]